MAPSKLMEHGSYQYELTLRNIYLHEYFHWFYRTIKQGRIKISKTFEKWSERIWNRYGHPALGVHEENMADNFALYVGFIGWNRFQSEADQRGYIMTFTRMFCDNVKSQQNQVTDHGSSFQRGTLPLHILKPIVTKLFNCTF